MAGDRPQDGMGGPDGAAGDRAARPNRFDAGATGGDSLFLGMGAICETAARLTGADGAAVAVLTSSGDVRELVHATDALSQQIDELQFTLGEGPCLDAYANNQERLCGTLDDSECALWWPMFTAEAVELGVAAVFAFPVPGALRPMGVLELYRRTVGELTDREHASALVCATAIRGALETNWNVQVARSGSAKAAVEAASVLGAVATQAEDPFTRSQVHVAAGMIAVQLRTTTHDGLSRLRAYAYAQKQSVVAVAADVVSRRLSFEGLGDGDERGRGSR